jgi:hypothetical protein
MKITLDPHLAAETKALVALAFRNGPIEVLHAGQPCASSAGIQEISHISNEEMKSIMKSAVDTLYRLLWQQEDDPAASLETLVFGERHTIKCDDPEPEKPRRREMSTKIQNP